MAIHTVYVDGTAGSDGSANGADWDAGHNPATPWQTLAHACRTHAWTTNGTLYNGLVAGDTYNIKIVADATRRNFGTNAWLIGPGYAPLPNGITINISTTVPGTKFLMTGDYSLVTVGTWTGGTITVTDADWAGGNNVSAVQFDNTTAASVSVVNSTIVTAGTGDPARFATSLTLSGTMTFSGCAITGTALADYRSPMNLVVNNCTVTMGVAGTGTSWWRNKGSVFTSVAITNSVVTFYAATASFVILVKANQSFTTGAVFDFTGSTITATLATSVTDGGAFIIQDGAGGATTGTAAFTFSGTTIVGNSAAVLVAIGPANEAAAKVGQSPGGIQSPTLVNTTIKNNGTGGALIIGYGLNSTVLHDCQLYCGSLGHGVQLTSNNLNVYNLFITGNLGILNWGDNNHVHNCVLANIVGASEGSMLIGRPGTTNVDDLWLPTTGGEMDHNIVIVGPGSSCTNAFYAKNENVSGGAYSTVYLHDNAYLIANGAKVGFLGGADRATVAALQAEWQTLGMAAGEANSTFQTVNVSQLTRRR